MLTYKIVNHVQEVSIPFKLYTIGSQKQSRLSRRYGISANQVFICLQGEGIFHFHNKEPLVLAAGQGLFIPADVCYECYPLSDEPWILSFVSFHSSLPVMQSVALAECTPLPINDSVTLQQMVDQMWSLSPTTLEATLELSSNLYTFLLHFKKLTNQLVSSDSKASTVPEAIVSKISTFIYEQYDQDLKVQQLAKMFGYSLQHLNRLFKARYGTTIHQYLIHVQLEHAERLMLDYPELSLHNIAEKVGMEASYFMKVFRKKKGLTPRSYKVWQKRKKG
jgi:AraC family transcriptional regulator